MSARGVNTTRRPALRRIGLWVLGLGAVAAGFVGWGVQRPAAPRISLNCSGGPAVKQRILVAYATRAGSTAEVAKAIGDQLCAQGFDAQVQPVESVASLDGYHAVLLGSAVRYSAWLPEMLKFIESQRTRLTSLPVAIFTLHMQSLDESEAARAKRAAYVQAVRALVTPRAEAFFAGKVDPAALSFFERMAVKMVKSPVGDKRDWNRIRDWGTQLGGLLQ